MLRRTAARSTGICWDGRSTAPASTAPASNGSPPSGHRRSGGSSACRVLTVLGWPCRPSLEDDAMPEQPRTNLTIDPQRLWDQIMETAKFGGTAKGGIKRLTLTDDDRAVRDWFKAQCEALGCTVAVDSVGNMFARRRGGTTC